MTLSWLSHQISAYGTLKLLKDVLYGAKVSDSGLSQKEICASSLTATISLVTLVSLSQFLTSALFTTELAPHLVILALFKVVIRHILLDDVIFRTDSAYTALFTVFLEHVITNYLLATSWLISAIQLYSTNET